MQSDPRPSYNYRLVERVVEYLQTREVNLFPFTVGFDDARERAFVHDLRDGLGELVDSGSARKSAAVGFIMSDKRLFAVVEEWAQAGGEWPAGSNPSSANSAIAPQPV